MTSGIFYKEYVAILDGILENNSGIIEAPIARKENSIIERCISSSGEKAITKYEVLKVFDAYCLVKFILETGRTHQIRVHSSYIGHPILGDSLYGTKSNLISRQALHSYKTKFIHPINKKQMEFCAEMPKEFQVLIKLNNIDN